MPRGRKKGPPKVQVSLALDAEIVERLAVVGRTMFLVPESVQWAIRYALTHGGLDAIEREAAGLKRAREILDRAEKETLEKLRAALRDENRPPVLTRSTECAFVLPEPLRNRMIPFPTGKARA